MRKVIFLDFDGVLISHASIRAFGSGSRSQPTGQSVAALNWLLAETGASVVVTSTWRLDRSAYDLQNLLRDWGVECDQPIGITPRLQERRTSPGGFDYWASVPRGKEIRAWLAEHSPVCQFVILDDDDDMEEFADKLIQTKFETGLTHNDAVRARDSLLRDGAK